MTDKTTHRVAVTVFGTAEGYDALDAADALAMNVRRALTPPGNTMGYFGEMTTTLHRG